MKVYEKEVVTKIPYIQFNKKLERPIKQVRDLLGDLQLSEDDIAYPIVVEDKRLRDFLEIEDVIEVNPVNNICKVGPRYQDFVRKFEALEDVPC